LKSPFHVSTLPALFAEYPDARVIHTHRDPRRFVASLVSLLSVLRFMRSETDQRVVLGPIMEMTYQLFLEQVIAQRSDGIVPDDQIVDTHFLELMSDPVAMLHRVYGRLGYDWPKGHDRAITAYLAAKPKAKHGAHTYSYGDLGLDEDHVRATSLRTWRTTGSRRNNSREPADLRASSDSPVHGSWRVRCRTGSPNSVAHVPVAFFLALSSRWRYRRWSPPSPRPPGRAEAWWARTEASSSRAPRRSPRITTVSSAT
jgi:hypothetical protein